MNHTAGMSENVEQLRQWDRTHVWHGFTQMAEYEPLIIERGEGNTLVDIDGNFYLDAISSLWCNVHGHRHPHLDAAIRRQLDQVAHVTNLGASNPTTVRLARKLVEIAPSGLQHVFFSDSGSTAVEVALKLALQFWRQVEPACPGRDKYVAFESAYHGDTIGGVSVGGVARFHDLFRPLLFSPLRAPAPDMYRLPAAVTRELACGYYLDQLQTVLERHGNEVAAVILEPRIQGAAGMMVHPQGFLRGVRELTRRHDVLLIADEVATGFGRTGTMFACQHEDVQPDLLCLGKGLSGGYLPVAATLATTRIFSAFLGDHAAGRTFFHGHTFGGNPLGAAVSLASLELFERDQVIEQLPAKIEILRGILESLQELPCVGDVRQCGMMAGLELVRDRVTKEPFAWEEQQGARVCRRAVRQGVLLRPLGNVVVIMPPLSITGAELEQIGRALRLALLEQFA